MLSRFAGFYALRRHKNTQLGFPIKKTNVDPDDSINEVDDATLEEELVSCQHFLVDFEFERARQKVFNYTVETLNERIVNEKLDHFSNTLKREAKVNCTRDDLAKLKDFLNKADVIESCSPERTNTKWRFYRLTNLSVIAALLKDVPMGCKDAVLPEPLLKNCTKNCVTFEENTRQPHNNNLCFFHALALHLHGNQRLEGKTSKLSFLFIKKMDGLSADCISGVQMNDISFVEDLLTPNILLHDIDNVDGNIIVELARRSLQKPKNTMRLLRYNHICYVNNIDAVFQSFRCPNCYSCCNRTFILDRYLATYSERVKIVYPKNVYQTQETLFDKLDSLVIEYTIEQRLFQNLASFDFQLICVQEESFKDADATKWIGKHIPISVFHFLNSCEKTNFPLQLQSATSRYFF